MNLYMKQRVFSWGDQFYIYDSAGNPKYSVEGEVFSWGKKLHLYDQNGNELAFIQQKLFSWLPKYYVSRPGYGDIEVVKDFTFFRPSYSVPTLNWSVEGSFWEHSYEITDAVKTVASVSKEWFTFGDAYQISIGSYEDEIPALAVVLVIDACIEAQNNN